MTCAAHIADPSFQLKPEAGWTGPYDCSAHSTSDAIDHATCGRKDPGGRTIRLLSSEPIPDPRSPGLNLNQVANVAQDDFGVYIDVRIGYRKVTFAEYEKMRLAGMGCLMQVGYGAIADSRYDAGRGFRGNHMMFESIHATYDPLADGRAAGVFRHDGSVYDRAVMKRAAGNLVIGSSGGLPLKAGFGNVWAGFTRDVIPDYRCQVPAGEFFAYAIKDGAVAYRRKRETGGFSASCTPPRSYVWPGHGTVTLVRLTSGSRIGRYISANWVKGD
jgi:hypothetical protein